MNLPRSYPKGVRRLAPEAEFMRTHLLALLVLTILGAAWAKPHSSTLLGQDAMKKLEQDENLIFSPYSLQAAFAMTSLGAKGPTQQEMTKVLHLEPGFQAPYRSLAKEFNFAKNGVAVANRIWPATSFKLLPKFVSDCKTVFGAAPQTVNYQSTEQARKTINAWVSKVTRDKIPELLKPGIVRPDTPLVLTNAVYFKRKWAREFSPTKTRTATFHSPKGSKLTAMMSGNSYYDYFENAQFQMVVLPYLESDFAMALVVPKAKDGWKSLRRTLPANLLDLPRDEEPTDTIQVHLPKLKFRKGLDAKVLMQSLGMERPFTAGADFSGLSDGGLFIGAAVHEAFLEVNEQGTEAAAATAVVMTRSQPRIRATVKADRPFFFLIFHQPSKATLFMGQVVDPTL